MGLCSSHTETGKEKQSKHKSEPNPQAVLWHSQNRNPHKKRENTKTQQTFDLLTNNGEEIAERTSKKLFC